MSWRLPKGWPQGVVPPDLQRFGLGPRLAQLAAMVPLGKSVADLGTDHGLVPIALVGSGRCPRAIAIDRSEAPLARARRNAQRLGVEIELRLGDRLLPHEAEVAIIAGLGGRTICALLQSIEVERIVVQPNTGFEDVRIAMAAAGYESVVERFVADGDRFFLLLAGDRSEPKTVSVPEAFLGKVVADPLFDAWSRIQRTHWSTKRESASSLERLRLLGGRTN